MHSDSDPVTISRGELTELQNLREEVRHLRMFRDKEIAKYDDNVKKLKEENAELRMKIETNENSDAKFKKLCENVKPPARREPERIVSPRRPTFPGSARPNITLFDGSSKKAFNQTLQPSKPVEEAFKASAVEDVKPAAVDFPLKISEVSTKMDAPLASAPKKTMGSTVEASKPDTAPALGIKNISVEASETGKAVGKKKSKIGVQEKDNRAAQPIRKENENVNPHSLVDNLATPRSKKNHRSIEVSKPLTSFELAGTC